MTPEEFLWRPGMYLRRPGAELVLSMALDRALADEIDDEVRSWLVEACEAAG